mmetsp:Transcript_11090/g.34011  ORF Transcript_11090/g.34011 Transcript_11090/m.34011 type:complete len:492 (+) Transcript_11090:107-1582(+)|eukprot:CAMPEP_0198733656 /NCGR_PEP_ID=MMETSP1475-20131203/47355_1 /TAXON_ID= ORGANISM="Unidentified sp., Strain CCMP1999" /NCGR_SAMPLE_ID=MMETSP1475 /ASSEMBLY_ACC=CAM_ASM_001111 /LENGTH=491 /DNA_ID=CAMNT_0044496987 /DNA_START=46 /DNA_END=1521 /DNA_ORIENTATION=+
MSTRRSSRIKTRIDYNESTLSGQRRSSYSVYGNGIICESETTELTGNPAIVKLSMPRALRDRDLNVEESAPLKEKDGVEELMVDDDDGEGIVEDIVTDEVVTEAEPSTNTAVYFLSKVGRVVRDSLDNEYLRSVGSRMGFNAPAVTVTPEVLITPEVPITSEVPEVTTRVVSVTPVQEGRARGPRNLTTSEVLGLILVNAVALSLAVMVLADSGDGMSTDFQKVLGKIGLGPHEEAVDPGLFRRREFYKLMQRLKSDSQISLEERSRKLIRKALQDMNKLNSEEFEIEDVVKDAAEILASDRGLGPDYALTSAGAKVLSAQPSSFTQVKDYLLERGAYLFGRRTDTLSAYPNSAAVALSRGNFPGECWAFSGGRGNLSIQLARPVSVHAVAIDHAAASTVPTVSSAPKDFRVTAYDRDGAETLLGEFTYNNQAVTQLQMFTIPEPKFTHAVRLEILSNHGGEYTCLYRFRVHGPESDQSPDILIAKTQDPN